MTNTSELKLNANWAVVKMKGRYATFVLEYKDKMADRPMEREPCMGNICEDTYQASKPSVSPGTLYIWPE